MINPKTEKHIKHIELLRNIKALYNTMIVDNVLMKDITIIFNIFQTF